MHHDMGQTLTIELSKYPNILKYLQESNGDTYPISAHLALLDHILEKGHDKIAQKEFGMPINELIKETYDAHFDYKGITQNAGNSAEAEALSILEWENNPLSYITGGKQPRDTQGNPMPLKDFLGVPRVNFKHHLQRMLYSAKYLNHVDYVNYLMLGAYDLQQIERNKHIEQLLAIQPALRYQEKQGLVIGDFLDGTGFFDCGEMDLSAFKVCPSCQMGANWEVVNDIGYCMNCKAAVKHKTN